MEVRSHKLVPWESWNIWNEVRQAIFSSSPIRVCAALNKIAAWRTRSSLPVAVEVTGDLISIQRIDPCFCTVAESSVTNEMLCLMYAMAIMRLINGVVDQSKMQNTSSVAMRAEAAGLPRMLVDIRHEVAHQELPSLSYLQLASKQALEWLKVHYWEAQKQVLDDMQERLQANLHVYASQSETPQNKALMRVRGCQKLLAHRARKLVTLSSPVVNLFGDSDKGVDIDTTDLNAMPDNLTRTNAMPDSLVVDDELIDVEFQRSQHALSRAKKRLQSFYKSNRTILSPRDCSDCDLPFNTVDTIVTKCNTTTTSEKIAKGHTKNHFPRKEAWTIVKDWRPCAIGMLPSKTHPAGVLPFVGSMLFGPVREATCQATVQGKSLSEMKTVVPQKETPAFIQTVNAHTQFYSTGEKSSVDIATTESAFKRFKADTETCQTFDKREKSEAAICEELEVVKNSSLLNGKPKPPLSGGLLLLHGLYQRCGADELAAYRSSIQVLK